MARSIKFQIINEVPFTTRQLKRLYNTSAYYSKNNDWILDEFWVGPGKVEPNMEKFQDQELAENTVKEFINNSMNSDSHFIDVVIDGIEKGILKSVEELDTNRYSGSVRVAGNEKLARIVLKALSEISLVFPKATIKVQDEGHLLFSNLIIRKSKAIPDTSWVPQLMRDMVQLGTAGEDSELSIRDLSTIRYYKPDKQARLDGLKYIVKRLSRELNEDKISFKELKHIPFHLWPDVEFYLRNVRLDDFEDYTLEEGLLLSGYFGEHWNVVDVDTEAESFRLLADMQRELKNHDDLFELKIFN